MPRSEPGRFPKPAPSTAAIRTTTYRRKDSTANIRQRLPLGCSVPRVAFPCHNIEALQDLRVVR